MTAPCTYRHYTGQRHQLGSCLFACKLCQFSGLTHCVEFVLGFAVPALSFINDSAIISKVLGAANWAEPFYTQNSSMSFIIHAFVQSMLLFPSLPSSFNDNFKLLMFHLLLQFLTHFHRFSDCTRIFVSFRYTSTLTSGYTSNTAHCVFHHQLQHHHTPAAPCKTSLFFGAQHSHKACVAKKIWDLEVLSPIPHSYQLHCGCSWVLWSCFKFIRCSFQCRFPHRIQRSFRFLFPIFHDVCADPCLPPEMRCRQRYGSVTVHRPWQEETIQLANVGHFPMTSTTCKKSASFWRVSLLRSNLAPLLG